MSRDRVPTYSSTSIRRPVWAGCGVEIASCEEEERIREVPALGSVLGAKEEWELWGEKGLKMLGFVRWVSVMKRASIE